LIMTKIDIVQGDITRLQADAIVNAANKTLLGGGGVDGAIHLAAGPELLTACKALGGCETGQAKMTPGFKLPARFVIHTVGPVWCGGNNNEKKLLADCYYNSLQLARSHCLRSIAFPAISTGVYRFPLALAAEIVFKVIQDFLKKHPEAFDTVIFVLFSSQPYDLYRYLYSQYFPPAACS
jgi:O-acetyl-ADP-ribose deacetylase